MITLDLNHARSFLPEDWLSKRVPELAKAREQLINATGAGGDFTGWVTLPSEMLQGTELTEIEAAAQQIRKQSEVLVVIGIGGSYLGARAVYELLEHTRAADGVELIFAGNGLSSRALNRCIRAVHGRDFSVNVISKSGTTTEPAVAFRIFRSILEERYGKEEAAKRIFATTDARKGALRTLAEQEHYARFVVPDNVGGRYSVLTAVGLLPLCAAGIDIRALLSGAMQQQTLLASPGGDNLAWQYAAARNELYSRGTKIELLASYEPAFQMFSEWWKQLYGESEGKEQKGLFPASVQFTADLHSMGQYIQEGQRILMETVVHFEDAGPEVIIPSDPQSADGLEFLADKPLSFVQTQAMNGTALAHEDGGVPNIRVCLKAMDAFHTGELIYFFEYSCGLSGYLLGVNPFNQPGVEAYKKNMFALLGKPGYEQARQALLDRL